MVAFSSAVRCFVVLLVCFQMVQGLTKFRSASRSHQRAAGPMMAVDPSLVGSLSDVSAHVENLKVTASVAGDLGQSTSSALKGFAVNIPEASQMLTTTLRSAGESTGGVINPVTKLPLDLGVFPTKVAGSLSPTFQTILSEPKYWGSIIIAVIISDIMQNSAAVQKKNRVFTDKYDELEQKLVATENAFESVKALQADAVELSKQLESARAEVAAYKLKEEFNSKTLSKTQAVESAAPAPAAAAKEVASPGGSVARDMEISRLKKELAEEKKKRAAAATSLSEVTSASVENQKATIVKPAAPSKDFIAREKALVEGLKKFLVKEGYMVEGLANMLMAATAPAELEKLMKGGEAARGMSEEDEKKMATMEKELTNMVKEMGSLQKENTKLSQASSSKPDADAYVKELTAEVEGLKKQLLSSDERLMDLQQEMQKKVDSAKLMTKELNARLQESEAKATKWMEAATAAKTNPSAPAATKSLAAAAPAAVSAASSRKAELQGMTQAAVKKLTKVQLEKDALALGATSEQVKGLTKPKVLDIVFKLL